MTEVAATFRPGYPRPIDMDKETPTPDPAADWWTTDDIAAYLGVKTASVRRYKVRGDLPPEDRKIGRTLVWKPATIIAWNEHDRPGQGWRAGREEDGKTRA